MKKNFLVGVTLAAVAALGFAAPASALEAPAASYGGSVTATSAAPGAIVTYEAETGVPNGTGTITATPDVEFISTVNTAAISSDENGYVSVDFRLPNAEPGTVITLVIELSNGTDNFADTETITIVGAAVDADGDEDSAAGDELSSTGFGGAMWLWVAGGAVLLGGVLLAVVLVQRRRTHA